MIGVMASFVANQSSSHTTSPDLKLNAQKHLKEESGYFQDIENRSAATLFDT